jgi:hypothetical protein
MMKRKLILWACIQRHRATEFYSLAIGVLLGHQAFGIFIVLVLDLIACACHVNCQMILVDQHGGH